MFGLDMSELLIIAVVALVVVGPKELPQLLRTVGAWVGKARRMAGEFQAQMNQAIREADLEDVKKQVDDLRSLSPKAMLADQLLSVGSALENIDRDARAEVAGIRTDLDQSAAAIEAGVTAPVPPPDEAYAQVGMASVAQPEPKPEIPNAEAATAALPMDLGATPAEVEVAVVPATADEPKREAPGA